MRMEFRNAIALGLVWFTVGPGVERAQNVSATTVVDRLEAHYRLTRLGIGVYGEPPIEAGTVVAARRSGILCFPLKAESIAPVTFKEGEIHAQNSSTNAQHTRLLTVGEKIYITRIKANMSNDQVAFAIQDCDSCNGIDRPSSCKAIVVFQFPPGYLGAAEPGQIEDVVGQVLAVEGEEPKLVEEGREAANQSQSEQALTNNDIVRLVQAKLPDSIVLAKIKSSTCNFDITTDGLIRLKQAGVSEAVLQAMVDVMTPTAPPEAAENPSALSSSESAPENAPQKASENAPENAQSKQAPTLTEAIVANWNDVGLRLVTMAEDWPEDKYSYRLAPAMRTFQQVILHIAGSNYDMINRMTKSKVGDGRNDPPVSEYATKAATVAFLKKSVADGAAEVRRQGDEGAVNLLEYWDGYTEHMGEHYGLLVAYYRGSGGVPPESRPKK